MLFTALSLMLVVSGEVAAQSGPVQDAPRSQPPLRPMTRQELDRREAVKLYGLGLLHERDGMLVEAVHTFERAMQLDPDAPAPRKALVPLYLALDRFDDALDGCRKVLDLDPGDYETWYLYARQLRVQDRPKEALAALERAVACPEGKERHDLRLQMYLDLAVLHESAQVFDKAEAAFTEVIAILEKPELLDQLALEDAEINAQAAETYERLGRVCIRAKHYNRAVAAFRKAQLKDPDRKQRIYHNLAEVYLAQDNMAEALTCLDEYLLTQPQGTESYELKVKILTRLGRERDILPALEQAAERDRHNNALKLFVAGQYARAGQTDQALARYQALIKEAATPDVYRGLFTLYKEKGRAGAETVLRMLDEALAAATSKENQPGNAAAATSARAMLLVLREDAELVKALLPIVQQKLTHGDGLKHETRYFFAVLAARTKQLDEAEALFQSCLDGSAGAPRRNEADIYGGLLKVLWQARKYDAIVRTCRRGLEHAESTNRILFHLDLARALILLGKAKEAIVEANAAVELARDEDRLLCRRIRAQILGEADRFDQAEAECLALLKEFSQPSEIRDIRYTLSSIYSSAKKQAKAEEQLQMILQSTPDDATANNDLGYIWADQGKNLSDAEKLIRKALELDRKERESGTEVRPDSDQDNAAYIDSLGWVLFRRGQLQAARKELERAAGLQGGADDPVVWDHLGDVYMRLDDPSRARSAYRKAVELYEAARRRQLDDRYKEIKQKLKLVESQAHH